ncbi:MAG: class II fructose-bisphosphate aldolase [Sphingomonadaceae bacterium]
MNSHSNVKELLDSLNGIVSVSAGQLQVQNEQRLRDQAIDSLIYDAVFGPDDVKAAARWIIWESGQQLGILPASIQDLYEARGRGEVDHFTVPAMNIRGLTYDISQVIFRAALRNNVGPFVFEIARSEMGYTDQRPDEYAIAHIAAAIKTGYRGPVFIQGDHFQVNRKRWEQDPNAEIAGVKKLIDEAIPAGFYNIDIDTSTLVDLSQPDVDAQQRNNFVNAAELTAYVRSKEPKGITISVGGEIGEVGGKNSTPEELDAFMNGYLAELRRIDPSMKGISKISIQTGTEHGGVVLPDGRIADVALDFETLKTLSHLARTKYGLAGAVQHGASTLPDEAFHKFVESGCCEVHLATAFQNMLFESRHFPDQLRREMYDYLKRELADQRKPSQTEGQFIYKTRKNAFGPFKKRLWDLPKETKDALGRELEEKFVFLFQQLSVVDTRELVDKWIKPVKVSRPVPDSLGVRA